MNIVELVEYGERMEKDQETFPLARLPVSRFAGKSVWLWLFLAECVSKENPVDRLVVAVGSGFNCDGMMRNFLLDCGIVSGFYGLDSNLFHFFYIKTDNLKWCCVYT